MVEARQELIVVDASLAFKWLVVEEDSYKAVAMLGAWLSQRVRLVAPYFMVAEVAGVGVTEDGSHHRRAEHPRAGLVRP